MAQSNYNRIGRVLELLRMGCDPFVECDVDVATSHPVCPTPSAAAELSAKLGTRAEVGRELAYRLYILCERKKRAQEALAYNALVQSWPEVVRLAGEKDPVVRLVQGELL